ncbi:hypothetical protein IFM89_038237 [Coptis chinensis]|uniref:Reverse transcriptase zinc-binding domain-containing protein n=1 Tax=Coptis chinensis TaxID=261450 RepID=A0A835I0B7_9MAGN|nr:hypothetical protein IFM89_038237 [Coptis chinensis]
MLIQGDQWKLPVNFIHLLQHHGIEMAIFQVPPSVDEDQIVWSPNSKGVISVSSAYAQDTNELMHLLWACEFARSLWAWLATRFGFRDTFLSIREAVSMAKGCSTTIQHMWGAAVVGGMTMARTRKGGGDEVMLRKRMFMGSIYALVCGH